MVYCWEKTERVKNKKKEVITLIENKLSFKNNESNYNEKLNNLF
jgi:hypothetical protein